MAAACPAWEAGANEHGAVECQREGALSARDGHSGEGDGTGLLERQRGGLVLSTGFHLGDSPGPFQESGKPEEMAEALVDQRSSSCFPGNHSRDTSTVTARCLWDSLMHWGPGRGGAGGDAGD